MTHDGGSADEQTTAVDIEPRSRQSEESEPQVLPRKAAYHPVQLTAAMGSQ
jgi:hypothetical protein